MKYINIMLLLFYIYICYKYYKKVKEVDEQIKESEIRLAEMEVKNIKLQKEVENFFEETKKEQSLHN